MSRVEDAIIHPRVVVSDNASNLTSSIIEEIYRVYGIRKQQIAVYQSTQNSIKERIHAVIKDILKKLCAEAFERSNPYNTEYKCT